MSAKLIFSDIDGTLINNELKVTPKTRDAIRHQIINGNIFIPASARLPKGIMTAVGQILTVVTLKSKIAVQLGIFIAAMCGIAQKKRTIGSKKKKASSV